MLTTLRQTVVVAAHSQPYLTRVQVGANVPTLRFLTMIREFAITKYFGTTIKATLGFARSRTTTTQVRIAAPASLQ